MSKTTIEEAAKQLDAAVREVRRLPWGESPSGTAKVLANYETKKRALALAVLEAVLRAQRDGADSLAPLRAQIKALGE